MKGRGKMKTEESKIEVIKDEEQQQIKLSLEDAVRKYFMNKEIAKERNEENKMLLEQIVLEFEELNGTELIIELPEGTYGKVFKKAKIKEQLDKEILVERINKESTPQQSYITKDDLKTPWDYSMLTKQERITPKMIAECTISESFLETKVTKVKNKPKKSKKNN